ncbi:Xylulose kinase [Vibrio aerogenes CECT 7868]|uniref:Xylulose kinase n=1 Tax=Vibrio aerogenes CECT 7868 TaxID=1216006 RepID=A0A1M5ZJS3_9VIBR|nr:xylulokinase [Vibrio aerogenes]SHI24381.1 Xylulose kinase [Vibrio aerogenes CECT 7868]
MYIGIDLGTSGVKVIALSSSGEIIATGTSSLDISRPQPLWSEQNPLQWWQATCDCIQQLGQQADLKQVKAIGLSGQMHGATLIDVKGNVLRPAILWNDGRCARECQELETQVPESRQITGNLIMPGFTAPKLKWVQKHEPDIFTRIAKVLLPKDYLRWQMTGQFATDMSDAAGTCWLDLAGRCWNDAMLQACGLTQAQMPKLYEGTEITGYLSESVAKQWGMPSVPVIAGGGDNAAGAVGSGITRPGQAMLSLGTSGVYFAVSDGCQSNPASALHTFCHALPKTWHHMSVMLSAASCLDWVANLTGFSAVGEMLTQLEDNLPELNPVIFLPYLSGERTPHNNPDAKGVFFGMTHETTRFHLVQAVLEGVGFAFADGADALHATGNIPQEVSLIGGGARSAYWRQMLADITGMTLTYRQGGDVGPALGAARLAALGTEGLSRTDDICPVPPQLDRHQPDLAAHQAYQNKRVTFRKLYQHLKPLF